MVPLLITPAFSSAIDSMLLPKIAQWSKPMLGIITISASKILVASKRPPRPTSSTNTSQRFSLKITRAASVVNFKKTRDEKNQKIYNHTKSKTEAEYRALKYQESLEQWKV